MIQLLWNVRLSNKLNSLAFPFLSDFRLFYQRSLIIATLFCRFVFSCADLSLSCSLASFIPPCVTRLWRPWKKNSAPHHWTKEEEEKKQGHMEHIHFQRIHHIYQIQIGPFASINIIVSNRFHPIPVSLRFWLVSSFVASDVWFLGRESKSKKICI